MRKSSDNTPEVPSRGQPHRLKLAVHKKKYTIFYYCKSLNIFFAVQIYGYESLKVELKKILYDAASGNYFASNRSNLRPPVGVPPTMELHSEDQKQGRFSLVLFL